MATVKTQLVDGQRRVITKLIGGQRRVSCSCCVEGCCMYPADQYNVSFFEEDLPDELKFNFYSDFELIETLTAQKNATQYGIYWWPIPLSGGEGYPTSYALRHDGNVWGLYTQETPNIEDEFTDLGGQRCLIDDPDTTVVWFEDNFEDTYTVTTNQATGVVTRQSLCVWRGIDDLGCSLELRYESRISPPQAGSQYKWTVDFAEGGLSPCDERAIAIKTPNQNTPVGSYDYAGVSVA